MSSDAPVGAASEHSSTADSIKHWVAAFLHYLELRLQLLGLEGKEAGVNLFVLRLLVTAILVLFCGFLGIFAGFLLYLIISLLHLVCGLRPLLFPGFSFFSSSFA